MTASPLPASRPTALQAAFRAAMASVGAPVSVVTTLVDGLPCGTTVNAFASLSMQPPMVLMALDLGSDLLALMRQSGGFGLNVLSSSQTGLALNFARKGGSGKFAGRPRGKWPPPCPASRRRLASWPARWTSWWPEVTTSWCSGTCSWPCRRPPAAHVPGAGLRHPCARAAA